MAKVERRMFVDEDPAEFMQQHGGSVWSPLMVSIAGYSNSGKTESALLIGEGVRRVVGGPLFAIDSEGGRMREKAGIVPFRRVALDPPYTSQAYHQAVEYCVSKGAQVIVIDNLSDEHKGMGGVLQQFEAFMSEKCGNDWSKREKWSQAGWARVKAPRAEMEQYFKYLMEHKGVVIIATFRADEKYKPKTAKEKLLNPEKEEALSWSIESTSEVPYMSTVRYVLETGSDGVPILPDKAANTAEKKLMKVGRRYKDLLKDKEPFSIEFGIRLAKLCRPQEAVPQAPTANTQQQPKSPAKTQPKQEAPADTSKAPGLRFHRAFGEYAGQLIDGAPAEIRNEYEQWLDTRVSETTDPKARAEGQKVLDAVRDLNMQIAAEAAQAAESAA